MRLKSETTVEKCQTREKKEGGGGFYGTNIRIRVVA